MKVRLIRKLAERLDGVDLSGCAPGDLLELPLREAQLLVAEGWALPFRGPRRADVRCSSTAPAPAIAADRPTVARVGARVRTIANEIEAHRLDRQERRRAEDRIREERREACARTIQEDRERSA
jgi:hypothetical protein